ncbi:hypothetical protein, unlikely [Trypanosoma congolense IL3000]|uniref:Uncharacterized protein n=1 Tax=Trypanosoma congolense (strain IL3000) TaxID=1068625 RepID=F9WEC0_TRYCI|nr:hypothetical protein, unlikely [Trypanosoma congolense IL3000]
MKTTQMYCFPSGTGRKLPERFWKRNWLFVMAETALESFQLTGGLFGGLLLFFEVLLFLYNSLLASVSLSSAVAVFVASLRPSQNSFSLPILSPLSVSRLCARSETNIIARRQLRPQGSGWVRRHLSP